MSKVQQVVLWTLVVAAVIGLAGGASLYVRVTNNADHIETLAQNASRNASRASGAARANRQTLCALAQLVGDVADPSDDSKFGRDSRTLLAHAHDINCPPNAVSFPKGGGRGNGGGNPGGRPGPPPGGPPPKPDCTVEVNPSLLCLNLPLVPRG